MKCPVCNKDIKPNEPAVQVHDGYLNEDGEFVSELILHNQGIVVDAYYHSGCYDTLTLNAPALPAERS